jgi:uncharacterized protein YuzE
MRVQYFTATDTLYIEFRASQVLESLDLDGDTVIDVDECGQICALTMERAKFRADAPRVSFEEVAGLV